MDLEVALGRTWYHLRIQVSLRSQFKLDLRWQIPYIFNQSDDHLGLQVPPLVLNWTSDSWAAFGRTRKTQTWEKLSFQQPERVLFSPPKNMFFRNLIEYFCSLNSTQQCQNRIQTPVYCTQPAQPQKLAPGSAFRRCFAMWNDSPGPAPVPVRLFPELRFEQPSRFLLLAYEFCKCAVGPDV